MIVEATALAGVHVIRPRRHVDPRGSFTRLWCEQDFARAGIPFRPIQISASFNARAGTLRGLHWQEPPHAETKLVRASRGLVFDVAVDLRPASPTRLRWFGLVLDADEQAALLIPSGFAHGFITLTDGAEVMYAIDVPYAPDAAHGLRYDDPAIGIAWPREPVVIADKDLAWPPCRACGAMTSALPTS